MIAKPECSKEHPHPESHEIFVTASNEYSVFNLL